MTREEIRLQVAISVIQGVLEAKHGVIGEVVPSIAVSIALRIADAFVEEWYRETKEQPEHMIQWTGHNLKEVIDFTGKSPRFGEWFKSWDEFESYVHSHGDILKLFSEDGSHFEVPVGAWIVKTPDGHNVPSVAKYVQQEQSEDLDTLVVKLEETIGTSPHSREVIKSFFQEAIKRVHNYPKQEQQSIKWKKVSSHPELFFPVRLGLVKSAKGVFGIGRHDGVISMLGENKTVLDDSYFISYYDLMLIEKES